MASTESQEACRVVIVSPALAAANNGNWQTAHRWRRLLAARWPTRIVGEWPDAAAAGDGVMLALHARKSATAIRAWAEVHPGRGLAVVLTGTDLYADDGGDATTLGSQALAQVLVVLQELGPRAVAASWRSKTRVVFQSSSTRQVLVKTPRRLRALMVGHLRAVKAPETLFAAAALLAGREDICIDHIGAALDPALAAAARAAMAASPHYRWLGELPHAATRRRIQQAHVLVHASRAEGGAHVIMEAACSGTPVLASAVDGNVGMLGADYAGYFPCGDAAALARLLLDCRASQGDADGLLARLQAQCRQRAPLFAAAAEQAALHALVRELAMPPLGQ